MPNRTDALADQIAPLVFAHPARVLDTRAAADADWQLSDESLLALAKKAAPDASIFANEERAPYFWPAEISSQVIDAYSTIMGTSSLKNYARDASKGVAILPGHDHATLPYGYSLRGQFFKTEGEQPARVVAHSYTVRGLVLAGVATNDVIDGMRAGLIRDVSIGFYGGEYICSICGRDMLRDWDCWHWPGMEYAVGDASYDPKTGKPTAEAEKVLCTASVENAGLSEISHVYDGATPNAMILRAQFAVAERLIKPELVEQLSQRYRARIGTVPRSFAGVEWQSRERPQEPTADERKAGETMPPENDEKTTTPAATERAKTSGVVTPITNADPLAGIRAMLDGAGVQPDATDLGERVRFLITERERLIPLADDGEKFRTRLIEQTIKHGVRAWGDEFKPESERADLGTLSVEAIERRCASYERIADKTVPTGRGTEEQTEPAVGATTIATPTRVARPAWAYGG